MHHRGDLLSLAHSWQRRLIVGNNRVETLAFCRTDVILVADESKKQTLHIQVRHPDVVGAVVMMTAWIRRIVLVSIWLTSSHAVKGASWRILPLLNSHNAQRNTAYVFRKSVPRLNQLLKRQKEHEIAAV